jgi:hypothetical protein
MICTKLPGKGLDRVLLRWVSHQSERKKLLLCTCSKMRLWFDATEISDLHFNIQSII